MIDKITQKEIDENSVSKLSTRPNAPSAMGGNGLNAAELRARFDALAMLAINKINDVLKSLNGEEDATPFAQYIQTTLEKGDGTNYTLADVFGWLFTTDFAEKIILVAPPNGENYTLAQFFQDFNITPSFGTLVGVEHSGNENVDFIHGNGISYRSKIRFNFQDFCYPTNQEFPNETLIPIVAGDHIEFSTDDRDKVVEISAIVEQSFDPNSTEAQSGKAVFEAIEEVDLQSQQRTEQAKQELVDYVEEALQDVDVDVQVSGAIGAHNVNETAHQDIRNLLGALSESLGTLSDRINAALNSDDTSLDQLKEIVAYIKSNKQLIDYIYTSKVSVDAIADNLTTNDPKKVLSAKQGMVLKQEIPLVLPYTIEWKKEEALIAGATGDVQQRYFNRTPQAGDQFSFYCYRAITVGGSIAEKSYHVSAHITVVHTELKEGEDFLVADFVVDKAVLCTHPIDANYSPYSPNAQSGVAVAEAIAAIPKEVHNITSIETIYETVGSLPSGESNGTTYLVINGDPDEHEEPCPSLYAYNGTKWEFKEKLKAHTLYCVLTGEKSGIYRYTMASPYLKLAEQAAVDKAKEYTDVAIRNANEEANQQFSNAATAHKEGTLVVINDISPIQHGVRVWDKANPNMPVSVYLSENEYDASTTKVEQNTDVVVGDGFIRVIPKTFNGGGIMCTVCTFTAPTSGTYHFSCDFSHTGTVTSPLNRENEVLFFIDGAYHALVKLTNEANTTYVLKNIPAGSVIKASFYPSVTSAVISTNYVATLSNIFIGTSAEEKEVVVEAGGTVSSIYPCMAIIAKTTSTTLAVEYNRDINKVVDGLKTYMEQLLGVIENGTY